ncbi:MAG: hypothetical protein HYZ27_03955, partial [Deltaproteobacteria bacterium]|nr:hypothetical protein [Deltaproteobacteria bacterium]
DKIRAGDEIVRARYRRMTRLAIEAQGVLGEVVARADVGFSPGQTFYTTSLRPLWKNVLQAAASLEYVHGETWYLSLTGFGLAVFRVPQSERVLLLEPESVDPGRRHTALFYGGAATGRRRFEDADVVAQASAIYTSSRDLVTQLQLSYDGIEPPQIKAGMALIAGERGGIGDLFDGNDFAFLAYRAVW